MTMELENPETPVGVCYKCGTETMEVDKFCPGCGEIVQTKIETIDRAAFMKELMDIATKHLETELKDTFHFEPKYKICVLSVSSAKKYEKRQKTVIRGIFRRHKEIETWDELVESAHVIFKIEFYNSDRVEHPALQCKRNWVIWVETPDKVDKIKRIASEYEKKLDAKIRIVL